MRCLRPAVRAVAVMPLLAAFSSVATVTVTTVTATPAAASAAPARFVPVAPERLLDTRIGLGAEPPGKPGDLGTVTVQVTGRGNVPAEATAVVLNVTATESTAPGFVTVYPAGPERPNVSSLNLAGAGQTIPNLVTVPIGQGGRVSLFAQRSVHLLADVFGYFVPAGGPVSSGRFVPVGPQRAYDSRQVRSPLRPSETIRVSLQPAGVPSDATAAVLNVTVVDAAGPGYWTVYPAGTGRPGTSNLNTVTGQLIPNQVIVPVTPSGIDIFAEVGGHVLVDVAGWFTSASAPASSAGLFVPVTPTRLLDTRESGPLNPLGPKVKLFGGWTVEVPLAGRASLPPSMSAVVMNATVVSSKAPGFFTAWAAGGDRPLASNLNAERARQTIPNHVISPVSTRGVSLFTQNGAHLIADVTGYFTGTPQAPKYVPFLNPAPPMPAFPGRLIVPKLGLNVPLYGNVDLWTLSYGPGYWPGTAQPGQSGQVAIFGHRTEDTRPFRYLDALVVGDTIDLVFDDTTYRYVVDGMSIVWEDDFSVIDNRPGNPATLILAACHPVGSTAQRLIAHAVLADTWAD